jgi:NAD(P)-dependent dehydrogenase (short-subunit alcohol dehydrogenase family)
MRFADKVVVIPGGGGGIGKAAAQRFLEEGARVVLNSRRQSVLDAAHLDLAPHDDRVAIDDRVATFAADVSSQAAAQELIDYAVDTYGRVDVVVNSTGIFRVMPFLEQTEEHVEEALNSILRPTYYVTQAAVRDMMQRGEGGAIVSVGSMWAVDAITSTPTSAYSAAQAGRHSLTKNLAIELAQHGIRVNTVALGFVETPAYERFMSPEEARQVLDSLNAFQPLGRHGQPDDVVEAILFFASDDARWITGTTLHVDGGVLAGRSAVPALPHPSDPVGVNTSA